MTPTLKDTFTKHARLGLPLAGLGVLATVLAGCGGATSGGAAGIATPTSGPVIYGVNALALFSGGAVTGETSGLSFNPVTTAADGTTSTATAAVITGATAYHTLTGAGPLPAYQAAFTNAGTSSSPGVPLGFGGNGIYYATTEPVAALPTNYTGTLVFGTYISQGAQNNQLVNINTSSVVLTSPEAATFSVPLAFDLGSIGTGVLAQAQYRTAAFPMPAFLQTTGLHILHATISDTGTPVQSSATDFSVVSLAPSDSAALVTISYTNADPKVAAVGTIAPVFGATATITSPNAAVAAYKDATAPTGAAALPQTTSYTDAQGVAILFAVPGTQTVTISGPNPFNGAQIVTGTAQVTLVAGVASTSTNISATLSTTTAPAAIAAHAKMVQRHVVKH